MSHENDQVNCDKLKSSPPVHEQSWKQSLQVLGSSLLIGERVKDVEFCNGLDHIVLEMEDGKRVCIEPCFVGEERRYVGLTFAEL